MWVRKQAPSGKVSDAQSPFAASFLEGKREKAEKKL
jgi:hypothetical protein